MSYTLRRIVPADCKLSTVKVMRWGIVGCGLIGHKRAAALRALGHQVVLRQRRGARAGQLTLARITGAQYCARLADSH